LWLDQGVCDVFSKAAAFKPKYLSQSDYPAWAQGESVVWAMPIASSIAIEAAGL
jgi:hypothetical protein